MEAGAKLRLLLSTWRVRRITTLLVSIRQTQFRNFDKLSTTQYSEVQFKLNSVLQFLSAKSTRVVRREAESPVSLFAFLKS
jgi:hypothetical protein